MRRHPNAIIAIDFNVGDIASMSTDEVSGTCGTVNARKRIATFFLLLFKLTTQ